MRGVSAQLVEAARTRVRAGLERSLPLLSTPEIAWGLMVDGRLVDGERTDRIFRIASMTKSFTAAAVLGIRHGLIGAGAGLDLDAPLGDHIPRIREQGALSRITVRDALAMAGGLPTDDPWADRLESISRTEMDDLLQGRPLTTALSGTAYEYSNFGYALLGRLVEELTGKPYREVVEHELLHPLGMRSSGFDFRELPEDALVTGFRRTVYGGLEELPYSAPGAFSAIGGMFSTVRDLMVWIGWLLDAVSISGPLDAEGPWARPLRDMQQPQRFYELRESAEGAVAESYGYGLHHRADRRAGEILYHSGGYPGFGSHMRWHPATRSAVVVMGNLTYFSAEEYAAAALDECVAALGYRLPPVAQKAGHAVWRNPPSESAHRIACRVEALIQHWDDAIADEVFAENMDRDFPRGERRAQFAEALRATGEDLGVEGGAATGAVDAPEGGGSGPDLGEAGRGVTWSTAAQASWSVRGPRGVREVRMQLSPFGRVQKIDVRVAEGRPG
ncbi:serine hydrolase domain-containing protein [Brevibacterium sp.]|uniref:serine hydrolase domain-containing protein n=1 Tax=Brevibacterium sp. TaxID=1701 RepID=UPI0025BD103E|nr:serine hydrolase domain-containing protein [Brevibacterium sp.]